MQGQLFLEVGRGRQRFSVKFIEWIVELVKGWGSWALVLILSHDPLEKLVGGASTSGMYLALILTFSIVGQVNERRTDNYTKYDI